VLNLFEGKELPVYGDGLNVRDWLFVDDHAEALWLIVTKGEVGQTYNVGGNNEWTNLAIVHKLIELVAAQQGKPRAELEGLIRYVKDRPGHDRRYAIDSSKLQRELGWKPRHDLESGLTETVRWYAENGAWVSGVRSGAYREWLTANYGAREGRP
jgi:dTDP-glucose 4,6-dehydratase